MPTRPPRNPGPGRPPSDFEETAKMQVTGDAYAEETATLKMGDPASTDTTGQSDEAPEQTHTEPMPTTPHSVPALAGRPGAPQRHGIILGGSAAPRPPAVESHPAPAPVAR